MYMTQGIYHHYVAVEMGLNREPMPLEGRNPVTIDGENS